MVKNRSDHQPSLPSSWWCCLGRLHFGLGALILLSVMDHQYNSRKSSTADTSSLSPSHSLSVPNEEPNFESNYEHALQCLTGVSPHTSPQSQQQEDFFKLKHLQYPENPLDHYQAIHSALSKWNASNIKPHEAAGYNGPWVENFFAQHFQPMTMTLTNQNFSHVFGPFIPLFIPWTDIFVNKNDNGGATGPPLQYPDELYQSLRKTLSPDVLYLTVNQNDDGLPGNDGRFFELFKHQLHIVVMSAGGYGHVPIPLLKQPESIPTNKIPVRNRTHFVTYAGSRNHAPNNLREKMIAMIKEENYYHGDDWRNVMLDSKFSLCPRGFGRTSYHVMETLQMGLVPIQVYLDNDIPWLPYHKPYLKDGDEEVITNDDDHHGYFHVMNQVSFTVPLSKLPALLEQLQKTMTDSKIAKMERTVERLIDRYFSFRGVMMQIEIFLKNPLKSDLICRPLPVNPATNRPEWFFPPFTMMPHHDAHMLGVEDPA